ncbi:ATP-binding cassette domain-containing protein [Rhodoferax sp.]|uniref:ATP-binding cassette domain-containing protein n=1 Tax=Rhodoferax sp. TaxID=50421 RepID=UPI00344BF0EA
MGSGRPQSCTELLWGKMGSRISSLNRQCFVVSSVSRQFAGIHAITDVSASFGGCEIVSIIGPNGVSKTSLLSPISGLYMTNSGQIASDGIGTTCPRTPPIAASNIEQDLQEIALLCIDLIFGEARLE